MSRLETPFFIGVFHDVGATTVHVAGELTGATAFELRECLGELLFAGRRRVILNLAGVSFLDHAGAEAVDCVMHRFESAGAVLELRSDLAPS